MPAEGNITVVAVQDESQACFDVLGLFSELVATLATERAKDGLIALEEVHRILALVRGAGTPLSRAMQIQEGKCRRSFKPSVRHATSRNDVFRRLLVRPFETLLEGADPAYPRCFLGNYFEVVEAALGEHLKQYDQRSREIFQDMLVRYGNDLAWEVFFADPRARAVLSRVLSRILRYLESPVGQWAWVTCMGRVNADGARPSSAQADMILAALRSTATGLGLVQFAEQSPSACQ